MRTTLLIVISFFSIFCAAAQTDSDEHDFGTILVNDKHATHTFKVCNKEQEPLIIKDVRARCSCLESIWSKEPILPGDTGYVSVRYHINGLGVFNKKVKVVTNQTTFYVKVKGEVKKH